MIEEGDDVPEKPAETPVRRQSGSCAALAGVLPGGISTVPSAGPLRRLLVLLLVGRGTQGSPTPSLVISLRWPRRSVPPAIQRLLSWSLRRRRSPCRRGLCIYALSDWSSANKHGARVSGGRVEGQPTCARSHTNEARGVGILSSHGGNRL